MYLYVLYVLYLYLKLINKILISINLNQYKIYFLIINQKIYLNTSYNFYAHKL